MHIYKAEEWQSPSGRWLCGDVSALAADSNYSWYPARILGISPENFVKMLIAEYHVEKICYLYKADVLVYWFSTLADCRKYKNHINKIAREKHFVTY